MNIEHLPVMGREMLEIISPFEGGVYVDATVGLGGHSEMLLSKIGQGGKVVGIDRDDNALARTAERLHDSRLILQKGSFSDMESILHSQGIDVADGVLLDLGVSMMQLKDPGRGFSFNSNERLDMRMDSSQELSAWDVVNGYSERELVRILKEYGEEYRAVKIVRSIIHDRNKKSIDTCKELADIISGATGRTGKVHPATKTFQALRIEVNKELDELKNGLDASLRVLRSGGRLCVISYHSLEDRVVKHFIKDNAKAGIVKQLLKKPLVPAIDEIRANPSSRSAKLRGAEKP
ncbi:MAG: 16S rRNA (cytosine(1402)-N(4))-methyltransferase RsmH [Thermodesulfovibrionales bacterium]